MVAGLVNGCFTSFYVIYSGDEARVFNLTLKCIKKIETLIIEML